jgi:hypothetical protein
MDRSITPQDYQDMKGRVEKELVLLIDKLTELQQEISPFKVYMQKEIPMLDNLRDYYMQSDSTSKKRIHSCNSDKKLVEWLRAQSAGLRKSVRVSECHQKKQEVDFDLLCRSVPRTDKSCNQISDQPMLHQLKL